MGRISKVFRGSKHRAEDFVVGTLRKYGYPPFGRSTQRHEHEDGPAYERSYSPFWVKGVAERQSLVNNSVEEKVNQAFRRGFSDWEKVYEAKCPSCKKEFQSLEPFKDQLGDDGQDLDDSDIDFSRPRLCPECDEMAEFMVPNPEDKHEAEDFFRTANMFDYATELLPREQSSIAQTYLQVCKEVAWDIQTFDDGWMIYERNYKLDDEGNVLGWDFKGAHRAPPYLMRYSTKDGKLGNEYWVCLECRAHEGEEFDPQDHPGPCDVCDNRTYEVFAYSLDSFRGNPTQFFIQGEFAHDSEYRPSRLYGLSPIISLADEAKTLEKMDGWYRSAYEQRRAPRGAIVVKSSNRESIKAWNQDQMNKMNADSQHIPVFMDDTGSGGNPLMWQPLLEEPAQMQHMQMREWFLDRIAAKYGVTAVFQKGGASSSGMSQSLEIIVSNRSAERLQKVFEDTFIPAFLGQLNITGWERHLAPPEEEDEQDREQLMGRKLQNVRTATQVGAEVEWTEENDYDIKPGMLGEDEEEGGGLAGLFGQDNSNNGGGNRPEPSNPEQESTNQSGTVEEGDPLHSHPSDRPTSEDGVDPAGQTSSTGGRPQDTTDFGGQPQDERKPTTDQPYRRSNDTVTTEASGFANGRFGGKPAEVISVLQDIDEEEQETTGELENVLEQKWAEWDDDLDSDLPNLSKLQDYAQNRPDKGYRNFKRSHGGDWMADVDTDTVVEQVFEFYR